MTKVNDSRKPEFSINLFWDINIQSLDYQKHLAFIIARVLDYGTLQDWKELIRYYPKDQIKDAALQIRSLFPKSLNFIALYLNPHYVLGLRDEAVNPTEIKCFVR